jgi:hypothetical protein
MRGQIIEKPYDQLQEINLQIMVALPQPFGMKWISFISMMNIY